MPDRSRPDAAKPTTPHRPEDFIDRSATSASIPRIEIDDETRRIARTLAPDLYLSALLAPREAKPGLIALAAFAGDVDRIVLTVSDPNLAEIRLQWWRDALHAGLETGAPSGSPVSDAVVATARRYDVPLARFDRTLDARILDLYADALSDDAAISDYLDATTGASCRSAREIIAAAQGRAPPAPGPLIDATAAAYGRAIVLSRTAAYLARGRSPFEGGVPATDAALATMIDRRSAEIRDLYAAARLRWRDAPNTDRLACLHLSLVPAYLRSAGRLRLTLRTRVAALPPFERLWCLWRARRIGLPTIPRTA